MGAFEGGYSPAISAAVSRMTHGSAGDFDRDLYAGETECRYPGPTKVIVTFSEDVAGSGTGGTGQPSDVSLAGRATVDTVTVDGDQVMVDISNPPTHGTLTMSFPGLTDSTGDWEINDTLDVVSWVGDAYGDGEVNAIDASYMRNVYGMQVDSVTSPCDFQADGVIDSVDSSVFRNVYGM
jgi:hypothetical protein